MDDDRKHIHYGAINPDSFGGSAGSGNIHLPSDHDIVNNAAKDMGQARQQHEDAVRAFEQRASQRQLAVPTGDGAVKAKLREFGEPVSIFGEGPYERRDRLRTIMAGRTAPSMESKRQEAAGDEDLFYTEGSEELLEARVKIAEWSIPRANQRLIRERRQRADEDMLEYEERVDRFCTFLQKSMAAEVSQVGDERPLTQGKFSPDAQLYCTSSWSGFIKLWKVPACEPVLTIRGHEDRCHSVAFHPQCKGVPPFEGSTVRLASASADSRVHLWSLSESQPVGVLEGHEDRVNRVIFHPMGEHLVTTSHDMSWRLWDIATSSEILLQEGHSRPTYGVTMHPDGSLVATSDLGGIVRVWDLRSGKCVMPLTGHGKQVCSLDFHPKGMQLATAADDHSVRIWDLRRRRCVQNLLAHNKLISEVSFEKGEGRLMLTASYDCSVKIWSTTDWRVVKVLIGHEGRVMGADHIPHNLSGHHYVGSVAFDRTLKFWSTQGKAEPPVDATAFKT
jgi:U4/U6 small nuclear ribonucleoprotein PRP4